MIECADAEDGAAKILKIVRERSRPGTASIRSATFKYWAMNRGGLGVHSLNIDLQQELNAPGELRGERFSDGGQVTYDLASSMSSVLRTRQQSTRAMARNPRQWSSR